MEKPTCAPISDIMSSSAYEYPNLTGIAWSNRFLITGIVAFIEPSGALYNSGSTANGTAFYMTPESSSLSLSGGTTLTYNLDYKNNTGSPQQIGSLLLSGYRVSDVISVVPISWISSKDMWGVEKKIINPNERLELTWSIRVNPPKLIDVVSQQQIQVE